MQRIISYYALTEAFKRRIRARTDQTAEFAVVSEIRNLPLRATLRAIRRLAADELVVAVEDTNARAQAGPLTILGALTGSRHIKVFWPDGKVERISRRQITLHAFGLAKAQITSRFAFWKARRQIAKMKDEKSLARHAMRPDAKRVLYLDANLSLGVSAGGSVGHTKGIIDSLIDAGFEVDYASLKSIPTQKNGARWLKAPSPTLYSFPSELNYFDFNRRYENFVKDASRGVEYSFIYQRMSLHNYSGSTLRDSLRIPLVLEYNGSEVWAWENWGKKLPLHDVAAGAERMALRNADIVVTVSEPLRKEVSRAGIPDERIVVYPNCVDPHIFDPSRFTVEDRMAVRERWKIPPEATVATFIGTFGVWHGVDFLAKAIQRLVAERREWLVSNKLHFLLIGDGLKMPEVRQTLGGEEFESFVTLAGLVPQQEAPSYLAASDIFLATHVPNKDGSAFFGSPTKLFEYMVMGKPIVAADLDQIGEILRGRGPTSSIRGGTSKSLAKLFTPGDEDSFSQALMEVVANPDTSAEMAERARAEVLANYTWGHHVKEIMTPLQTGGIAS